VAHEWCAGLNVRCGKDGFVTCDPAALIDAVDKALQAERERAAKVADLWAKSHSCDVHDENPCCHVRTGVAIAAAIREGKATGMSEKERERN
jgi:hypothetical protein